MFLSVFNTLEWGTECDIDVSCGAMTVQIGFSHQESDFDEVEFCIKAWDKEELNTLFEDFCKENHYTNVSVYRLDIVKVASSLEDLREMEEAEARGATVISSKFIFDDELIINDDRQSINGYLWAVDYLVDKLPSSEVMENINFYADYDVLTGAVKVWSSFYVPDENSKTGERNEVVNVELTPQEKAELIDVLQSYCKARCSQTCLELVNEVRREEGFALITNSLADKIQDAEVLKSGNRENNQEHCVKDER